MTSRRVNAGRTEPREAPMVITPRAIVRLAAGIVQAVKSFRSKRAGGL
jgi:hypothetical protein